MKALIVTINEKHNNNYGNKLQNYASVKILKDLGVESKTLCFSSTKFNEIKLNLKSFIHKITGYKLSKNKDAYKRTESRRRSFQKFDDKYLPMDYKTDLSALNSYDYYVVGSDQVWNPNFYQRNSLHEKAYFLDFAQNSKKVCMVPSFGVAQLPQDSVTVIKKYLQSYPYISVREDAGAKIVKELTGKDAVVLIDPTMMLHKKDWQVISCKPKNVDLSKPYIVTYFLGGRSQQVNADLKKYAQENNLQILNLYDKENADLFSAGPGEFVYLIENSQLVMTDSFHACVFSFIFSKPFLVYKREGKLSNMFSRIETFLEKFKLERKYADSTLKNSLFECDYQDGYEVLAKEREKSLEFLKKSMNLQ